MTGTNLQSHEIKPQFDLQEITPESIKKELEPEAFPVIAFPKKIQRIITETNSTLVFPIDYLGGAILAASAAAIGNSTRAIVTAGWTEPCNLFIVNVGPPGANKTHPIKFILTPIFNRDEESHRIYKAKKLDYDSYQRLPPDEKKMQTPPEKPLFKKTVVQDFTPESLWKSHDVNKHSIIVYSDELLTWIDNFGRYHKSGEASTWLSVFSGVPISVDRKSDDPILLSHPHVSVIGGIQPGKFYEFAKGGKTENGFIDRLLFVFPDTKKQPWSTNELDPSIQREWDLIVNKLFSLEAEGDPAVIPFTPVAMEVLRGWQKVNTDRCNQSDERTQSILSKMEIFCIRFSLILQLMHWACGESDKDAIDDNAVLGAIMLTDYFTESALRVNAMLPKNNLPLDKAELLDALPVEFKTSEGLTIAETLGIPERTFKRFLDDGNVFKKLSYGQYRKI